MDKQTINEVNQASGTHKNKSKPNVASMMGVQLKDCI
jgi:hypothetical protein